MNIGVNTSDDLIRYVEGDNYEDVVKRFEIVRIVLKAALCPTIGLCMDKFRKVLEVKNVNYERQDAVLLIPLLILGTDQLS